VARRRYSDDDRATALLALEANGGNVSRTAREMGIPKATLIDWTKQPDRTDIRPEKRDDLVVRLRDLQSKLLDEALKRIDGAPLNQLMTSFGIAVDKSQLLEGRPTEIHQSSIEHDLARITDDDLEVLAAISDRLTQRPASDPPGVGSPEAAGVHPADDEPLPGGPASPDSV